MKRMALGGRLLLRRVLTVLSLGAVSFMFAACYGGPGVSISGTVKSSGTDEPIPEIKVSVKGESYAVDYTDGEGRYGVWLSQPAQGGLFSPSPPSSYTVVFQDVDGPENGEFEDKEVRWRLESGPLNVALDPKINAR